MSKEIKNCPFCGGEVKLDENDFYMFCCDKCGAGITFAKELEDGTATDCNKDESVDKWNTRKPIENVVDQLEDEKHFWEGKHHDQRIADEKAKSYSHAIEIVKKGFVELGEVDG